MAIIRSQENGNYPAVVRDSRAGLPAVNGWQNGLPAHAQSVEPRGLSEYAGILWKQKFVIIGFILACGLASLLMTIPSKPIYQAKTTLEIKGANENVLHFNNLDPSTPPTQVTPDVMMQTQMELLRSKTLVKRVVQKLELDRASSRPAVSGWRQTLESWKQRLKLAPVPGVATNTQLAVQDALTNLKVHGSGQTQIVELLYESPDPQLAADFLNTLSNEYIEQDMESRGQSSQTTSKWLSSQLDELRQKVEKSQSELLAYGSKHGLVYTDEKNTVGSEKLRQLQTDLLKAQADRIDKQARHELASKAAPESLPQVLDSPLLRDRYAKLMELRREFVEQSSLLTPAHYRVKRLEAQINELNTTIAKESKNIVTRIANEYEASQRQERLLAAAYSEQSSAVLDQANNAVRFSVLKGEAELNRQLYESVLQKVKEAGIATALRARSARVIDPAEPPILPSKPNIPLNTSLGLAGGLVFGVMFAFYREGSDRRLQQPGDASRFLNVSELGAIPILDGDRKGLRSPLLGSIGLNGAGEHGSVALQPESSMMNEEIRATATSILFSGDGHASRVLALTSVNPQDGKTTTVMQLGAALARANRKVLLIDGDIRKPRLHELFEMSNTPGLIDVLTASKPIQEYEIESLVRPTSVPGLYVLPSGLPANSSPNLLHGPRLAALMLRLRLQFDHVLIDTPPMLQISDARVWGRNADAVILLLRAGSTTRDVVMEVVRRLGEDGTPLLGTILNYWNPSGSPYKYAYQNYGAAYKAN